MQLIKRTNWNNNIISSAPQTDLKFNNIIDNKRKQKLKGVRLKNKEKNKKEIKGRQKSNTRMKVQN